MKVIALGHASLIVETFDMTMWMDPLISGVHQEGLFDVYPRRQLGLEKLPRPTHVFVSHQHFDHFDVTSLAELPRDVHVIIPNDSMIESALAKLGFNQVLMIEDWSAMNVGETELLFTPSEFRVPEHGIVVKSGDAVLWNQVDTIVPRSAIRRVTDRFGRMSLLIAPWQPLRENFLQYTRPGVFPTEQVAEAIVKAVSVPAHDIALGACGFQYVGDAAWNNHKTFPISRPRAKKAIETIASQFGAHVHTVDPGRVFEVDGNGASVVDAHEGVTLIEAWSDEALSYRPGSMPGSTPHSVHDQLGSDRGGSAIIRRFVKQLSQAVERLPERISSRYKDWDIVWQVTVLSSEGEDHISIDFAGGGPARPRRAYDPMANIESFISLEGLRQLLDRETTWDNVSGRGDYSSHSSVFKLLPSGIEVPEDGVIVDILWLAFPHHTLINDRLEREISSAPSEAPAFAR